MANNKKKSNNKSNAKPSKQNQQIARRGRTRSRIPTLPGVIADQEFNKYIKCLQNPFDNPPVRLGGTTCKTALVTQRIRCVMNMSGILNQQTGGVQTDSLSVMFCPIMVQPIVTAGWTIPNASGDYNYALLSGASVVPSVGTLQANFTSLRIIAGGIRIRLIASTNNDQGEAVAACLGTGIPFEKYVAKDLFNVDEKWVGTARDGAWATWRPQDPSNFGFKTAYITNGIVPASATFVMQDYPVLGIGFTNMSTTTPPQIVIETVSHWECVVAPTADGLIATSVGSMTSSHQDSVLSGTNLTKIGQSFGNWVSPLYTGMNEVVQTGLNTVGRYIAGRGLVELGNRAIPLLM